MLLRKAGYKTGFIGKFGVNVQQLDREAMFDSFQPIGRAPFSNNRTANPSRSELAGDRDRVYRPTQGQRPVLSLGEF